MSELPVVAAIPNYNMGPQVKNLLSDLVGWSYSDIFVLDDASTDGSIETVRELDSGARIVEGKRNIGIGGNKNRILEALDYPATIHFIDADMRLVGDDDPAKTIREITPKDPYGLVGGLITESDIQVHWNYGTRICLYTRFASVVRTMISSQAEKNPERYKRMRSLADGILTGMTDVHAEPIRQNVFWAAEGNQVVDSATFTRLGGHDERLRHHIVQDLSLRMNEQGLPSYFDPRLKAEHTSAGARSKQRWGQMALAEVQIINKHGLKDWVLPEGQFRPSA